MTLNKEQTLTVASNKLATKNATAVLLDGRKVMIVARRPNGQYRGKLGSVAVVIHQSQIKEFL